MAFKVGSNRKVWWPVEVNVPVDGGKADVQKFEAQFEVVPQKQADEIVSGAADDKDLLARVLLGLRQEKKKETDEDAPIQDESGNPLAFEAAKALMLDEPYVRAGLYAAYWAAANGGGRRKNSR